MYFAAGVTESTVLHELGHAVDWAYGPGRLFATEAAVFEKHWADLLRAHLAGGRFLNAYAKINEQEYFAEAFRIWHGVNAGAPVDRHGDRVYLRAVDPRLCNIIDALIMSGTWPPGNLTWPDVDTRSMVY
jgi:hypothetical protein